MNKNLLFSFLVLLVVSCTIPQQKFNGVSFVASSREINQTNIEPVIAVNANAVTLMPFGFIRNTSSPKLIFNSERQWFGETQKGLLQYAREFEKQKISIMVKPQIWIWRGEFTGNLTMSSEEDWQTLEESYSDFILTYAKAAQDINAEVLCIGTELEQFVMQRHGYWHSLIQKIRKVYKGKLTYAANWDEFKRVPFWKELDYIGIDAYFPLSDKKTPSVADYEEGWIPHKKQIKKVQQENNKPVIFTEFGYRSVDFSGRRPWESNRVEGQVNFDAQSNGLQAIYNQFWKEEWFAGGFIWKWFVAHDRVGGEKNNRFTPQNKPAEKLLKELYAN
ncbi:MAG: glycoside hydrolase [Flavobacteriaceae bacterium]|nr:glycoside hydrolase [Flavobacteriaceae bacterium]|tara:strand:- start:6253 stop:7251 length:999 start_codon:yes stop_codon:yes gene_type:complete